VAGISSDLRAAGRKLLEQVLPHLHTAMALAEELEQRHAADRAMAQELNRRVGDTGKLMAALKDETATLAQLMRTGMDWTTGENHWNDEEKADA